MGKEFSAKNCRRNPTQERSRFTVEAILDAAVQVFEQHGYAAGTTARIAERAGVSVGSLYQYFPNKDAILVALADQHIAECHTLANQIFAHVQAIECSLDQSLRLIVGGFIELHTINPQIHQLLYEKVILPEEIQKKLMVVLQTITKQIRELLAQYAVIREESLDMTAYIIVQIAEHLTHQLVLHPPYEMTAETQIEEVVRVLQGYIQQQSSQLNT
ncbi:MAG: TetR/AcrR family transcriptional regulator [Chloroflexi bacterium AL-W]|nr:TetR/AcrR family transcriptional regulator [Chloroflexi bacterium AL-N1]NOK64863.1 TetR/AcrR family transcriptional regulator [Chloroflexi bacterium AL-N10]NOK76633.1 TetR/AcrR family transcriptional regulator [Chloroflexi bacterium AL-N5]NOK80138.1 TetR/AcrR family transcriptional regulator [Chloroflexi bacterium AL-W]NOK86651.1 TetR/AcrR family transcriptional regulator [Chloroflexi bacterium AL-N15]